MSIYLYIFQLFWFFFTERFHSIILNLWTLFHNKDQLILEFSQMYHTTAILTIYLLIQALDWAIWLCSACYQVYLLNSNFHKPINIWVFSSRPTMLNWTKSQFKLFIFLYTDSERLPINLERRHLICMLRKLGAHNLSWIVDFQGLKQ